MNLFNQNKVDSFKNGSKDAIGVFTKVLQNLKSINEKVLLEKTNKELEIELAKSDIKSLNDINLENLKIISKIEDIIS